ncbi:copper-binding protein [Labrys okinawensis]|uniref:Copper-binding protein n=1 Tax=Labrys okinawensis TaxID=346911 RepID=A0A2S9QJC6_9HYPH|nr:SCO family protein [Labrys okinawensis]PRH89392.1 copper-binding protein [Labrys okinawensis]
MTVLKIIRIAAWSAVAGATLLLAANTVLPQGWKDEAAKPATDRPVIDMARVGGPFRLTSHKGETIDNARLAGKPYLAFFGFTHCPDVCPTTLSDLTELMGTLGPAADAFNVLFVTVDPERDSQELLAQYMASFDARILALRGSRADTDAVVKAFAAYARKVPMEGGEYTMDHSAGVYVMDANGKFASMLDMHEPRETKLQKLRRIIDSKA